MKNPLAVLTLSVCSLSSASAFAGVLDQTDIQFGGYFKADFIASQFDEGALASHNIGRDFYIPSLTPVGGNEESTVFDAHARQTRFNFSSKTALDNGETVSFKLEFDFMVTSGGDERISNSYSPRVRHAIMSYGNWKFGQTWTNFMDVGVLPESLDFIGTTDGTLFVRQTQIRYSNGGLSISLENPETTLNPMGGGARTIADDNAVPDLTIKYRHGGDWGHVAAAALVRQLSYDNGTNIDDTENSYGISLSSKIKFGADDLRLSVTAGSGLGRYAALNFVNGAVLNANNELEAIDSRMLTAAYRHVWSDQWRSTLSYSAIEVDNDVELSGNNANKSAESMRLNLIYSPVKPLSFGVELTHATRELESGSDGSMSRLQFSAKYAF